MSPEIEPWRLVAPDWSALDTIWKTSLPFVLWPVGDQPLLAHWMDAAVRAGRESVELFVADRPAEVRAQLEGGAYWSRRLKVIPIACEADAPADAIRITGLPDEEPQTLPSAGSTLLRYWFALQKCWLARRGGDAVTLDTRHAGGGWIGAHASIHPTAKLVAPFWIGAYAKVGARCEVGPNALIGEHAVLDDHVSLREACVLPRTYLGCNTALHDAIASSSVLLNLEHGCRVDITDRFILGPVATGWWTRSAFQRAAAAALYVFLSPIAKLWCRDWDESEVATAEGAVMRLRAGKQGPLLIRRWPWLAQVARGNMRWIGILPRPEQEWKSMPTEVATPLRTVATGIFSLADVHGCHDPGDPEEWIHAMYQAQEAGPKIASTVLRNFWRLAWLKTAAASNH